MSNGISGINGPRWSGPSSRSKSLLKGLPSLLRDQIIDRVVPGYAAFKGSKDLIEKGNWRDWEDIRNDPFRNFRKPEPPEPLEPPPTFDELYGLPIDDPRLEQLQPLADSLRTMLPDNEQPLSFDFREPTRDEAGDVADVWGLHHQPYRGRPEHITIHPEGGSQSQTLDDLRQTLMHEVGHSGEFRDPDWMSEEVREAIYSGEAPFDLPGRFGKEEPHQRYADYVADALDFLQTSSDPNVDPASRMEYLEAVPHTKRMAEELLKQEIYEGHPLNFVGPLQSGPDSYRPDYHESFYPELADEVLRAY